MAAIPTEGAWRTTSTVTGRSRVVRCIVSTTVSKICPRYATRLSRTAGGDSAAISFASLLRFHDVVQDALEIGGQRCGELQPPVVTRVCKCEASGVQERPLEARHRPQVTRNSPANAPIERVSDDWVSNGAQVNADLVRAAGRNGNPYERHASQVLHERYPRD